MTIYGTNITNAALDAQIMVDVEAALAQAEQTLREKYPEGMDLFAADDSPVSISAPSYQYTRQEMAKALVQRLRFPRWLRME